MAMQFKNSAGRTISFAQAAFATSCRIALGLVVIGCMYVGAVCAFCM